MDSALSGGAHETTAGRSRCIGIVIPDLLDPFFPLIVRGVEAAIRGLGYGLFVCDSQNDLDQEKEQLRMLAERRVEGIILNPALSGDAGQVELLDRRSLPYVLLDRGIEGRGYIPGVYSDNRAGARMAVQYLLSGGDRKLVFLNGPEGLSVTTRREEGVLAAFRAADLDVTSIVRGSADYSVEGGERFVDQLLGGPARKRARPAGTPAVPFDALFAANDRMAIGAMRALRGHGIDVPGQVEVVGFDGIELGALVEPALTTIAQPAFDMGLRVARMLFQVIEGEKPPTSNVLLNPKLVVRASTRPRP